MEGSLGAHPANEVDGFRVNVGLILVGIVLFSDGDTSQRRTLLTKVCYDLTGINTRDGRNTLTSTPLSKTLNSSPVAVLQGVILDNDARSLDPWRLEVSEQAMLVTGSRWDAVVADQGLGEDKNLASVRGIGHRLGVTDKGGGEDGFTRDVGFGTKGLSGKDRSVLNSGESMDA